MANMRRALLVRDPLDPVSITVATARRHVNYVELGSTFKRCIASLISETHASSSAH